VAVRLLSLRGPWAGNRYSYARYGRTVTGQAAHIILQLIDRLVFTAGPLANRQERLGHNFRRSGAIALPWGRRVSGCIIGGPDPMRSLGPGALFGEFR
jgi:hypothetical protein